MTPRWTNFLLAALLLAPGVVVAQNDAGETVRRAQEAEVARQQADAQRTAMQQQAIRDKSIADMNNFLNGSPRYHSAPPSGAVELQARFAEFRQSIPKFRAATDDYRRQVGVEGKLEKPLKDIATQTDVMLRYLKQSKVKHPEIDPSEFKGYKQVELVWETLNSAERIGTFLDLAVAVEKQEVVSPAMLEFMYKLNGELLRLKWLASHTKD
jgi:hypothetical protein